MILSLSILLVCTMALIIDLKKSGYKCILNPFFLFLFLLTLYLVIPSVFTEEINYYYSWGIDQESIFFTRLMLLFFSLYFVTMLLFVFKSENLSFKPAKFKGPPTVVFFLWLVVVFYVSLVFKIRVEEGLFDNVFIYNAEHAENQYRLKNIAYLLIPITILLYFYKKSIWVFLPNVTIILIDLLFGSRTVALICIAPIFFSLSFKNRKLYLQQAVFLIFLLILVGVYRTDNAIQNVPWYLNALGEFRETFITLPLYINNNVYFNHGTFFTYVSAIFFAFLQPFRDVILNDYTFSARYIADDVSRGYGLGSNFIIDSIYYGWQGFLVSFLFLNSFLYFIYKMNKKLELHSLIIFMSLSFICLRLIVREGLPMNIGLFFFLMSFYVTPILYLRRIKL